MTASEEKPRLIFVGTGAMACLFGARFAAAAHVTLIGSWMEAITMIRARGIVVEESGGCTVARVAAAAWPEDLEAADLVMILVKAWQTEKIAGHLPRLLKPGGVALTLQNGLGNLEVLGPRACLGVTHQGATLLGPGRVQPAGAGLTWISGPAWLVPLFQGAGIAAEPCDPRRAEGLLWGKLAANCGINALTALLRVTNGELLRRPDAKSLMERAALECAAVAQAKGITLPFPDAAAEAGAVAHVTAANRSSMLQDVARGAPTECEAINGAVVRWGSRLGVATHVNEVLYRMVCALAVPPAAAPDGGV